MSLDMLRLGFPHILYLALSLGLIAAPGTASAGNTTGTTRTQTYQPGEPFTGLPGGAPGRGYGPGPSGLPSVYCQNWPGHSPYPQYPGTGPNTPCGPNFQMVPLAPPISPPSDLTETMGCSAGPIGSLDEPGQPRFMLVGWSQYASPANWDEWLNNPEEQIPPGLKYQIWKAQNDEITKPLYATNKPFFPGGQPLPQGMNWKQWWSTNHVCVWAVLRCFATPNRPLNSTCIVLREQALDPRLQADLPNYYYSLFLKMKVLPNVLPNDSIVPPWPQDWSSGRPLPAKGLGYDGNRNLYYVDLTYHFTLTVKPPSRARSGR
jgi:hypothetical protein